MSGAVCPACGVAVVPGYVRCPKCRKRLPQRPSAVEGGTAVETTSRTPAWLAIAAALVIAGGIIAFFALRKGDSRTTQPTARPVEQQAESPGTESQAPTTPESTTVAPTGTAAPNANEVAATLERNLKRQRLWATVSVIGARADVRSMSCSDAAIKPYLDEAAAAFKAAGLTKLRCVEDSGRVVTDRDL